MLDVESKKLEYAYKGIYAQIRLRDCTTNNLLEQGFTAYQLRKCLKALFAQKLIFKYGSARNYYYTVNEPIKVKVKKQIVEELIIIPDAYKNNFALAFRMGFTDIKPAAGKLFKGALSVKP